MTATTSFRDTKFAGLVPARGTFPIAENTLVIKGTQVSINASGQAVPTTDGDGFQVAGKASATFDNRTGSDAGGAAGALDVEVEYGIHGWAFTGGTPIPGDIVFGVDNQTVSPDSDSGDRGVAGYVTEVRGTTAYVFQSPVALAMASAVAVEGLEDDANRANAHFDIPISAFRIYSSGLIAPAWADGSADGIDSTAESHGLRWNPASTTAFAAAMNLPPDIAPGSTITLHLLGCRVGALDVTAALTASMLVTVVPTAALDADDLILLGVRCTYTRAPQG
jgi:hypothetical protein